jgi:D-glycero-D-manno-heptose 1,7-bisphosphate phosphatase
LRKPSPPPRQALFLDRDGVLIEDRHFLRDASEICLIPETVAALQRLQEHYVLIVASNQSGIGRGYFDATTVNRVNLAMAAQLSTAGVRLDAVYYCPHVPDDNCTCRKPAPGMLLHAAADWKLDLPKSLLVGDRSTDLAAGEAAGVASFLLPATDREAAWAGVTARLTHASTASVFSDADRR